MLLLKTVLIFSLGVTTTLAQYIGSEISASFEDYQPGFVERISTFLTCLNDDETDPDDICLVKRIFDDDPDLPQEAYGLEVGESVSFLKSRPWSVDLAVPYIKNIRRIGVDPLLKLFRTIEGATEIIDSCRPTRQLIVLGFSPDGRNVLVENAFYTTYITGRNICIKGSVFFYPTEELISTE